MDTRYSKPEKPENRFILWAVALLGFSSTATQIIVLREMLNIFSGNELITGIVISSWMLLTGAGAWLGKKQIFRIKRVVQCILWLSVLPILLIVILYTVKRLFFPLGVLIDFRLIFPVTLLLLAPYCLVSGHLFAHFTALAQQKRVYFRADRLYGIETVGSVVGGITVGLILIGGFSTVVSLSIILTINVIVAYFVENKFRISYLFFAAGVILLFLMPLDAWLKKLVFPNQQILQSRETPYGNVTITRSANQFSIFANHSLLYSSQNIIENEETVHFSMLQRPSPGNILLISGGTRGLVTEILKYLTVQRVDYVEENRWMLKLMQSVDTLPANPRFSIILSDIRKYLAQIPNQVYDVVILAVPPPSTLQTNRYYTLEFFRLLKPHLRKNAIVELALPSSSSYYSSRNLELQSLIVTTLKKEFSNVLVIPGEKDYVLASTQAISAEVASLSEQRGIATSYVNRYYIDDFTLEQQVKLLNQALIGSDINHDFKPLAVYFSNNRYMSMFSVKTIMLLLPLLVLLWPVVKLKPATLALYVSGFSISALEVFLLLSFQIVFGFVYVASGIII
ncbi:MAG: hypothetical protein Q8928_04900 [Bacteroidota bacterium]|nr:hypothetical protein [Bacteroidota bacterium]